MSDRSVSWLAPGAIAALALAPVQVVVATDYLSVEDAQKLLFPQADQFTEVQVVLSDAQRQNVVELAGPQPPHRSLHIWKVTRGGTPLGFVFVDEVVGREDFITYAAGIDTEGRLGALEVLSYRESHGGEIRNPAWRQQFAGRKGEDQLRMRTDIKNIAGATLSCEHVTQGVRWLAGLWNVALKTG
jgi:hypothetical protein